MSEKQGTMKVAAAAAAYLKGDVSKDDKLRAARGDVPLAASDLVVVLFFFCHDADPTIKQTALRTLSELPEGVITSILSRQDLHPRMLDLFARLHFGKAEIVNQIAHHPLASPETLAYLRQKGVLSAEMANELQQPPVDLSELSEDEEPSSEEASEEESEEFQSKYQLSQTMGVAEKIKMAITGDKEWRSIFLKDSNKMVSGAAIKNPRITDGEVLAVLKSPIKNDEVLRVICSNKEWVKNYRIRLALVENSKTPLPNALRYLSTLGEKEVAAIAKSKNVSSVLSNQAKRMLAVIKSKK